MATPEPDHPVPSEPRSGGVGRTLLFAALFFGLYVLSPGPLARIYRNRTTSPPAALIAFYAPLEYANDSCAPVARFYDWYFKMWGAR